MQSRHGRRRHAIETLVQRLGKEVKPAVRAGDLVNTLDVLLSFGTFAGIAGRVARRQTRSRSCASSSARPSGSANARPRTPPADEAVSYRQPFRSSAAQLYTRIVSALPVNALEH